MFAGTGPNMNALQVGTWLNRHRQNAGFGPKALLDATSRLSDNILAMQEQQNARRMQESKASASVSEDSFSFHVGGVKSDMTQFMRLYQNSGKAAASLEEELSAFHDRLSAFDKTILEYQNMADGNQPLPDGLSQEDVTILLDAAKEARSQYAKDGADAWNRHAAEAISGDMMLQMRMVTTMADSGKFGAEPWKLDSSSENFSKDMNAVLNLTGSLRHGFQENIDRIFQNWESNGYGVEKIQLHISQMAEQSDISQKETIVNAGNDSLAYLQRAIEDRIFAASTQLV